MSLSPRVGRRAVMPTSNTRSTSCSSLGDNDDNHSYNSLTGSNNGNHCNRNMTNGGISNNGNPNNAVSSGRSKSSFTGGFAIDWDEIDSIAEESLSVASSVSSSGHRKRKNTSSSSRKRRTGGNHHHHHGTSGSSCSSSSSSSHHNLIDALECGSLGRSSVSSTGSSKSNGSYSKKGASSSSSTSSSSSRKSQQHRKRKTLLGSGAAAALASSSSSTFSLLLHLSTKVWVHVQRLATIAILLSLGICSLHSVGSYLHKSGDDGGGAGNDSNGVIVNEGTNGGWFGGEGSMFSLFGILGSGDGIGNGSGGGDRQMRRALSRANAHYQSQHWPISVRDEQDDFELVSHPNDKITLSLPRFFLTKQDGMTFQSIHPRKRTEQQQQRLGSSSGSSATGASMPNTIPSLDRKMADMIGRTTVDGSRDFSVRTIFVSITSFRDWHCRYTIESIFSRAKYPERIRVGVVDQIENGQDQSCDIPIVSCSQKPGQALCQYHDQIDVYEMESTLAVGPPFARHIAHRMYRGEYYSLQIDSHTVFVKNWDVDLIEQLESTGNEMAVLTTYLEDAWGNVDEETGKLQRKSRPVICDAFYEGPQGPERRLRHQRTKQPSTLPAIHGMPQLQPYWSASFSFSRGHFILTVPYDPNLPMIQRADEEISMTLRAFTHGYDFYTPERAVCFDSALSDRNKDSRKSFLDHKNLYKGMGKTSLARLLGMVGLDPSHSDPTDWSSDPDEMFGIGQARTLAKFFMSFGVHPRERITEQKLCDFVTTGRLHKDFHEHLREDGMGLDYDEIHFRFHELQSNHDGGA